MEKLREFVIKRATAHLNQPLSSLQIDLIDRRLHHEFPHGLRIPNHPTYAHMIEKAIKELNEEDGSTEAMISKYIKEQFEELPWAHKSILNIHLNKLCGDGQLVLNASKRYSIPLLNEVQEFKMVNETSTEHGPASFLEENKLIEVDGDSTRDEHLTGLSEITLLEENPGQEDRETCEQRDVVITELSKPEMIGWTIDEALQDESLDETRTVVTALKHNCNGSDITRKKKRASERIDRPTRTNTRRKKKKNSKGNQTALVPASLDLPSSSVLSIENDCQDAELVVVSKKSRSSDPTVTRRYNTRKRKSKGKSAELTPASLDSPSTNFLPLEIDYQGFQLVVVSKKSGSSDVKETKKEAMERFDRIIVSDEPTELSDPIVTKRYNTRNQKSKGKSTELIPASFDSQCSNVLSLENDCQGTELVVVPEEGESLETMKKKKELMKGIEPDELLAPVEPRRYNTRKKKKKKNSIGNQTELICLSLDASNSNALSLENDCHGAELTNVSKGSGCSDVKGKKQEAMKRAGKVIDPRRYSTRNKTKGKSTELIPAPLDSLSSESRENENQQGTLTIYQEESKIVHSEESKWPSWVESLLETRFFGKCEVHPSTNNNICSFYCIDCMNGALCASCLSNSHDDHRVIRVCRTTYEEAVNISEIKTYLDISGIQIHKIQGKSPGFVSLKRAVQTRFCGSNRGPCACNSRNIPHPFCFCSLSCKHKHQMDVGAPFMGE